MRITVNGTRALLFSNTREGNEESTEEVNSQIDIKPTGAFSAGQGIRLRGIAMEAGHRGRVRISHAARTLRYGAP